MRLVIDKPPQFREAAYDLRTREFGAAFRDTTSSYKFFWCLAILDLLPALDRPVGVRELVKAMIIRAWAAVALFRLSLGKVDRLQACVRALQSDTGLGARTAPHRLETELERWPALDRWVEELSRFVPGRFLGSWFADVARATPYDRRGSRAVAVAAGRAWGTNASGPYRLLEEDGSLLVELAPGWQAWLEHHRALVIGFVEQQLTRYLQARNPSVPAIVRKLELPQRRSLTLARQWLNWAAAEPATMPITDIFSGQPLGTRFEIDHFLPWSFVAHDEFWNLCPTTAQTNRSKSGRLPSLDLYLPRLAALHTIIMRQPGLPRSLAASYGEFLGIDPHALASLTSELVLAHYGRVIRPLAQIAINQGFPSDWQCPDTDLLTKEFASKGGGS